jgi:hypothetical protein
MELEVYLYNKILPHIQSWKDQDIYAISFFVYSNEAYVFKGIANFSEFSIGYNTERDCNFASQFSEERWNFAFWNQNMIEIIRADDNDEGANALMDWYQEKGLADIGWEDEDAMFDEHMRYIGKGPNGYYELLFAVAAVARRLQLEGAIRAQFGRIPIIVHDLEYPWYVEKATECANPGGEAKTFLEALRNGFEDD